MIAIDFETYYSAEYSISTAGVRAYVEHPEFDAYLLSAYGWEGSVEFVGPPEDFDWGLLKGAEVWSHNKTFDWAVYRRLTELGKIPDHADFENWFCTSDLTAYLGYPRSLANSVKCLYGTELSKETRNKMKGKKPADFGEVFWEEARDYALDDAVWCYKIARDFGKQWPDIERWFSNETTRMSHVGVPINRVKLEGGIQRLREVIWQAEKAIPWEGAKLSHQKFAQFCRERGHTAPVSRAKDSVEADKWLAEVPAEVSAPMVAQRTHQSANTLLKKLLSIEQRLYETRSSGWWMSFELKYGGGHTLRDSGDGGVNVQNLPRGEMFGVDLRAMIEAPPGWVFLSADYAQIEPRVLAVLAKDYQLLEILRSGTDPYEAHARLRLGYTDPRPMSEVDPKLRHFAKEQVLALPYGIGAKRWGEELIAKGVENEPETASERHIFEQVNKRTVATYRRSNFLVTGLWKALEGGMRRSIGGDFEVELPSGRCLHYWDVQTDDSNSLTAKVSGPGKLKLTRWWGGKLLENLVQATARDIFRDGVFQLTEAGFPILLRVHDEVLSICREDEAQERAKLMGEILRRPPAWMPEIPLESEVKIIRAYQK